MKRPSFPLWLLRDVPAFMGLIVSFWTLIIVAMTSGCRAASASERVRDHFALLLAFTEARLDYALWREAYRRLGWSTRDIQRQVFAPTDNWSDTHARLLSFAQAFRNMNAVVDAYVGQLRAQYGISRHEARSPLRLAAQATSPGYAGGGLNACNAGKSSLADRRGRWIARACERDGGGNHSSRGPPLVIDVWKSPTSQAPPARPHPHAQFPPNHGRNRA